MTSERWQKIEELYHAALDCSEAERAAFVDAACAGDDELRHEVASLLAAHAQGGGLLEMPPDDVAAEMIASDENKAMIGRMLSHYQIVAQIGEGGMGKVYLARDVRLKRNLALKLLPQEFMEDRERVQRFEQEALSASALNHPNILTVYEIGQIDGLYFIATEYIEGQTLRQRITAGPIDLPDILEIVIQIASALAVVHKAGIVHRDIKPENVMIRRDSYIKVLDFGIAKLIELDRQQAATLTNNLPSRMELVHTEQGRAIGTPRYMSPEQIQGQEIDGRSDVFSLGVMLFEMTSGHSPFEGRTPYEVAAEILHRTVPPLSQFRPEFPEELERIVSKALAKDREQRYQNAQDLLTDLKNLKLELEVENRNKRVARPAQPSRPGSRKFKSIGIVAGLTALLLLGFVAYHFFFQSSDDARKNAGRQIAAANQIELLTYSLSLELDNGSVMRSTNQTPVHVERSFRFHFTPRARGYLYIIGPGEGNNIPHTFLTALPVPYTGVTTNHLEAGAEYSFPLGVKNTIQLGAVGTTNNFTIIFSPTALTQPAFLAARADHQLTESEQRELATFWEQHGKRAPELRPDESLKLVTVSAPADRNPSEPLIFEISVKRQ